MHKFRINVKGSQTLLLIKILLYLCGSLKTILYYYQQLILGKSIIYKQTKPSENDNYIQQVDLMLSLTVSYAIVS